MLLCAGMLGVDALARRWRPAAALALIALLWSSSAELGVQTAHFAQASQNILGQQGEVARLLAAMQPPPRRVLVNDAGVIPYLSELPALDGLGLGGFRGMPFARASVHGLPAVVELIERLSDEDRPDVMAIYPGWWGGVADVFGREIDRVHIDDNVICGADTMLIYRADWSTLAAAGHTFAGELEQMDVADLIDERAHGYRFPAPSAGWIIADTLQSDLEGAQRWDAGRIVPRGREESYRITVDSPGPVTLWLRSDADGPAGGEPDVSIELLRDGQALHRAPVRMPRRKEGSWNELSVSLPAVRVGDRLHLRAEGRDWRSFNAWLLSR
jgi:hypothetical protein